MAQVIADRRDVDFVLYEQLKADEMTRLEKYKDFNKKTFDMIITEARNFAIKELLPTNAEGDKEGLGFENSQVKVPQSFHRAYELFVEGEWTSLTEDPEWGGQGLPTNIAQAVGEYLIGSNWAVANYANMGHGTGKMIEIFGTQKQKDIFLKNLYTAKWGGTMLLTESQAGSDVGALTTTAVKNPDGTYSITGSKILSPTESMIWRKISFTRFWRGLKAILRVPKAFLFSSCLNYGSTKTGAWLKKMMSFVRV